MYLLFVLCVGFCFVILAYFVEIGYFCFKLLEYYWSEGSTEALILFVIVWYGMVWYAFSFSFG